MTIPHDKNIDPAVYEAVKQMSGTDLEIAVMSEVMGWKWDADGAVWIDGGDSRKWFCPLSYERDAFAVVRKLQDDGWQVDIHAAPYRADEHGATVARNHELTVSMPNEGGFNALCRAAVVAYRSVKAGAK